METLDLMKVGFEGKTLSHRVTIDWFQRLKKIGSPLKMTNVLSDLQLHEPSTVDCQRISP